MTADARDPLAEWAAVLLDCFAKSGVREVVLSPGSRSTPFALAAVAHPGLRCRDVIDERSAAFFALGQGRASGRPSLLICTSGTAGAHYLPAFLEADQAHVPLLALTADRPLELQGCQAPQTIDQLKLFGDHARAFVELGLPDASALAALPRQVAQAVFTAGWPLPGPVHLNARARKPLEPRAAEGPAELAFAQAAAAVRGRPIPRPYPPDPTPAAEGCAALAAELARAERPLFVAGPGPLRQGAARGPLGALARRFGAPVLAEAASQLRFGGDAAVDAFDAFVDLLPPAVAGPSAPDLIVQLGGSPTSTALTAYLSKLTGARRWVIAPHGWNDPQSAADALLFGDLGPALERIQAALPKTAGAPPASAWLGLWQRANQLARKALLPAVAAEGFCEAAAVKDTVAALPTGSLLAVGNSLPIREVDLVCPNEGRELGVLSQRGANGIDGLISGAAGAASVAGPVTLLLGDVSFLHDQGGLAAVAGLPLRIVVLNNGGGRIFDDLPIGAPGGAPGAAGALSHFTTPHEIDLGQLAGAHGVAFHRATSAAALHAALRATSGAGPAVVEVVLRPEGLSPLRRRLREALAPALTGLA